MSKPTLHEQALKANANNVIAKIKSGKTATAADLKTLQQVTELPGAEAHTAAAPVSEWTVDATALCDLLGCSKRHLYNLERDGIVVKSGPSKYKLRDCVRNRIRDLQGQKGVTGSEREAQEMKKLKAEARLAEAKAKREEGKSLDAAKAKRAWEGAVLHARAKLLALPERLGQQVATAPDIAEAKKILTREIHDVLNDLADYKSRPDAEELAQEAMEAEARDSGEETEDDDATDDEEN